MTMPLCTHGGQRTTSKGPRDQTQALRLGGKHFYLLSHLPGPRAFLLKSWHSDFCDRPMCLYYISK